jgi:hypothetical protein
MLRQPVDVVLLGFIGTHRQYDQIVAERINIAAVVDDHALGERLLGAHVAQGAQDVASHGHAGVLFHARQAEVGDPEFELAALFRQKGPRKMGEKRKCTQVAASQSDTAGH